MEEQEMDSEGFTRFLESKNIDTASLHLAEPGLFKEWLELFSQVHEESFVMQQKFRINPIRRKYPKVKHVA